jgi:hypothetical protein
MVKKPPWVTILFLEKIQFTLMKFQRFFNLNPKISKLAVYSPKVSKSGKVNPFVNFFRQIRWNFF